MKNVRFLPLPLPPTEQVLLRHHNSEVYARREARKIVKARFWLCETRYDGPDRLKQLADDPSWVVHNGKSLGVAPDHLPLLAQLVKAGIEQRLRSRL